MKVLDESGVKKIVKNYKDADKKINNNIFQLQYVLNRLIDRYDSIGFATYGVSNAENGLAIPLIHGISVCFIIEGTDKPIYGKILPEQHCIITRNQGSQNDLRNMVAITTSPNGTKYLIISEANISNNIVIKPVIKYNNGEYIDWSDDYYNPKLYVQDVNGNIEQIAKKIGNGKLEAFSFFNESKY